MVNNPNIRFAGFADEWVQCKFSNLAEVRRGLTYKPSDVQRDGIRVLRSSNIAEDTFLIKSDDVFVNKEAVKIDKVKNGDILITSANGSSRLVGKHALIKGVDDDTVHGGFMLVARAEKPEFVNAIMSSSWYSKFINNFVSGGNGAIGNLSKSNLEDQKVCVPSEKEQDKIGAIFSTLDHKIGLEERQIALLKDLKKGYLQKMFPKNGATVPELRFAGFADDWDECKLADVVSISAGGDVDKTKLIEDGGYPVLANALTNSGIVGYYDSYKVEAPAVTVTGRGDVGHAVARHVNFTPVVRLLSLKSEVLDADFLANILNQTNILVESTGVPQLTAPQLGNYKIFFPTGEEQQQIGNFFKQLDDTITANQHKLELLKDLKKGLSQQLFV